MLVERVKDNASLDGALSLDFDFFNNHVLCEALLGIDAIQQLASLLSLREIEYVGALDESRIPRDSETGRPRLDSLEFSNIIVVRSGAYSAIFLPSEFHYNGWAWNKWRERIRGLFVTASSTAGTTQYHDHNLSSPFPIAEVTNGIITPFEMEALETLNKRGKRIFYHPGVKMELSDAMLAMLHHDVRMSDDESGPLRFTSPFTHEVLTDVTHYCFRNPPPPPVWLFWVQRVCLVAAILLISSLGAVLAAFVKGHL